MWQELWGELSVDEALALAVHSLAPPSSPPPLACSHVCLNIFHSAPQVHLSEEDEGRRGELLHSLLEAERHGGRDDVCDDDDGEGASAWPEWADAAVDFDTPIGLGPPSAAQMSRDDACDDEEEDADPARVELSPSDTRARARRCLPNPRGSAD